MSNSIDTVIQNLYVTFHQNKFLVGAHSFVELPAAEKNSNVTNETRALDAIQLAKYNLVENL